MRVMVAGAGIGGLTMALSLHAAGIEVEVFEATPKVDALGVGINLQANAVRELTELGLADALASEAIETGELAYYNRHGQLIWSEPRGRDAGYAWPQYSIGRGALQRILFEAAVARIGAHNIHTGHHLAEFTQDDAAVRARFIDRATGTFRAEATADVLVGADGIHSAVRRQLYPHEGAPVYSGRLVWRGAVVAPPYLGGRTMAVFGHRDQRAVLYPIARAPDGNVLVNWIAMLAEDLVDPQQNWNQLVPKERFIGHFEAWRYPWADLPALVARTDEIFEFPELDRDPLPRWSHGRVTLLGDAAHPMPAVGSQAGSQAVVDARVLAYQLATEGDAVAALAKYEAIRLPELNAIAARNRNLGPTIVLQLAEERAPQGFADIDEVIPRAELEEISRSYKLGAGFDAQALSRRASWSVPSRTDAA